MKKEIVILKPRELFFDVNTKKNILTEFINIFLNIKPKNNSKLSIEIISSEESYLKFNYNDEFDPNKIFELLNKGHSILFSRGDIEINIPEKKIIIEIENFLSSELNNNILAYKIENDTNNNNEILIKKINSIDISEWESLNEKKLIHQTLLGNKNFTNNLIELKHTEDSKKIKGKDRYELWLTENKKGLILNQEIKDDILIDNDKIEFSFNISFENLDNNLVYIHDDCVFYTDAENILQNRLINTLKKNIPPRLQNYFRIFIDVNLSNYKYKNSFGSLNEKFNNFLIDHIVQTLRTNNNNRKINTLITKSEKYFINEEDRVINKRKLSAKANQDLYIKIGRQSQKLCKKPNNEQDLVLVTALLSQKDFFKKFEFMDYKTAKGIDCLANYKIFQESPTVLNGVVEFKYKLESFTEGRHPINLINLVIAWDVNKHNFKDTRFKLKETNRSGCYNIENIDNGLSTLALALKEFKNILIK